MTYCFVYHKFKSRLDFDHFRWMTSPGVRSRQTKWRGIRLTDHEKRLNYCGQYMQWIVACVKWPQRDRNSVEAWKPRSHGIKESKGRSKRAWLVFRIRNRSTKGNLRASRHVLCILFYSFGMTSRTDFRVKRGSTWFKSRILKQYKCYTVGCHTFPGPEVRKM